jgi:DNA invertase Pin-like site-specific DNA recombinase
MKRRGYRVERTFICFLRCGWSGQTEKARADHTLKKHPEELKPIRPVVNRSPTVGTDPKTCAIYLRVSTIDQNPESQMKRIEQFCRIQGMEPVVIYRDFATGKNTDRPGLQQMLKDTMKGEFSAVVFRRLSRFGRNLRQNIELFDFFEQHKIAVISVEEPYDTRTSAGRLIRNVMASVNEYLREEIIEQAKEGIELRRVQGLPLGRHPAGCGYTMACPWNVDHTSAAAAERRERRRRNRQASKNPVQYLVERGGENGGDLSEGKAHLSEGG